MESSSTKNLEDDHEWNSEFLEQHHLQGHIYSRTQNKTFYPYWKSQLTRNSFAKKELEMIGSDLAKEGSQAFLLKGFSLMGEIYQDWGERYVSDIDLLISFDELWKLTDILKMYGYEKQKVKRWLGNRHIHFFRKTTGDMSFSIEVHTQLFWHSSMDIEANAIDSSLVGFKQLSKENQLIHLCGHLALQKSYSRLYWLVDIYKYVERYKDQLDWSLFWNQAEKSGLYKSCYFTLFLCQKMGLNLQTLFYRTPKKKQFSVYLLKKIVDFSYLYSPQSHPIKRLLIRGLIADSIADSFRYSFAWFKTFKQKA